MRVFEERGVKMEDSKSNEQINLVYFLFWTSTYELIGVALFFWVDLLPWYGDANINNFLTKYVYKNSKTDFILLLDSPASDETVSCKLHSLELQTFSTTTSKSICLQATKHRICYSRGYVFQ